MIVLDCIYCTQSAITCSKLTIETLEQNYQWYCSDVFIANFEHISYLVLVFLLLTLSRKMAAVYMIQGSTGKECSEIYLEFKNGYNQVFPVFYVLSLLICYDRYAQQRRIQNQVKHLKWSFLRKYFQLLKAFNYFRKKAQS